MAHKTIFFATCIHRLDIASMNISLFKLSLSKSSPYARAKVKLNYTCKFHFRGLQSLRDTNLYRSGILSGKSENVQFCNIL